MKGCAAAVLLVTAVVANTPVSVAGIRLTHVLVLAGDSISRASSAGDARYTLAHLLESRSHGRWEVLNHGIGALSFTPNQFNGRVPDAAEIWATHAIPIVELGTNDWATSGDLAKFRSAYGAFLDVARFRRPVAYCITPLWRTAEGTPNARGLTLQVYRDAVAAVCQAHGAVVVDGLALVPHDPAYFHDGVHPNARGYGHMSRVLAGVLESTLPPPALAPL